MTARAHTPMWLAHHHPEQYERCVVVGQRHVCRRCLVLYPAALVVAVAQVAGAIPETLGLVLLWAAPVPVVVEWVLETTGRVRYAPVRQIATSAVAAVSLGIALGRHAVHPFEGHAVAAMMLFTAICLGTWLWANRGSRTGGRPVEDWAEEFGRAEAARTRRLLDTLGLDLAPDLDLAPTTEAGPSEEQAGVATRRAQPVVSNAVTKSMSSSTAPTSEGSRSL